MKRKLLAIILVAALALSLLPMAALAAEPVEAPFTPSVGQVTALEKNGYSYTNYGETTVRYVDLYTVKVPLGTAEVTLTFGEDRIAYGYDSAGGYVCSCGAGEGGAYANNGQSGEKAALVKGSELPAFVRVQTPYTADWSSDFLYAVKFEASYAFTAKAGGKAVEDIVCFPGAYSYYDYMSDTTSSVPVYSALVPFGAETVDLEFTDNALVYNYTEAGEYLAGWQDAYEVGRKTYEKIAVDAASSDYATGAVIPSDGAPDYLQIQSPYVGYDSTLFYAITFEPFRATAAGKRFSSVKSDLTYTNSYTGVTVPVLKVNTPADLAEVTLRFPENVLVYNYTSAGEWLGGSFDDEAIHAGVKEHTVKTDFNGDGAMDYILVQTPYTADWSSDLLYVITFAGGGAAGESAAEGKVEVDKLLENIAASYADTTSDWAIMDLNAYILHNPNTKVKLSDEARQNYINSAIASLNTGSAVGDTTYAKAILILSSLGVDATKLYPANSNAAINAVAGLNGAEQKSSPWNAPYTFMAYNQGDYPGTESCEKALLTAVLADQREDGAWDNWGTIDTTANVIAGLSFYADQAAVKTAIDKGIGYLATQMSDKGTYDAGYGACSNSTAMVIIGLCANGVDPSKDSRFVKDGVSVLDGLLSFALTDNSGFGYLDNTTRNDSGTEQSFRALIAAAQVTATGKACNVYDFSKVPVEPGRATGGATEAAPAEPTGADITVSVTVRSDNGYWLRSKSVTLPGDGAKVYHAFVRALEGTGVTQEGAAKGYVKSISYQGTTLAEFTKGKNAGWRYEVNGELPVVGLTACDISDGDKIVWFYTTDWTKEQTKTVILKPETAQVSDSDMDAAIAEAVEAGASAVIVAPLSGSTVTLSQAAAGKAAAAGLGVTAKGAVAQVTVPAAALAELAKAGAVAVSAERKGAVTQVAVAAGGKTADKVPGGIVVTVPAEKVTENSVVAVVGNDGSETIVKKSVDMGDAVAALVDGSCAVKVKDNAKTFTDTVGHWGAVGISFATSRGIFEGTGGDRFDPNGKMNRAMLATALYRMEEAASSGSLAFSDVPAGTWYSDAVIWASGAKIVEGYEDGKFRPMNDLTREQMVTMLYRYAKSIGMDVTADGGMESFTDAASVSSYAVDAMNWAVSCGLVAGKTATTLAPQAYTTRTEVATIMERLVKLMMK